MTHSADAAASPAGSSRSVPHDPFDPLSAESPEAPTPASAPRSTTRPADPRPPAWWKRGLRSVGRVLKNAGKSIGKQLGNPADGPRQALAELGSREGGITGGLYFLMQAGALVLLFQGVGLFPRPQGQSWLAGLGWHGLLAVAGPLFLAAGIWGVGLWGRHRPGPVAAVFVSGLAMLPATLSIFWCAGLFAFSRELALAGAVFGFSVSVLLLYHALLAVQGLSLRKATLATPALLLSAYIWTEALWFCLLRFMSSGA